MYNTYLRETISVNYTYIMAINTFIKWFWLNYVFDTKITWLFSFESPFITFKTLYVCCKQVASHITYNIVHNLRKFEICYLYPINIGNIDYKLNFTSRLLYTIIFSYHSKIIIDELNVSIKTFMAVCISIVII